MKKNNLICFGMVLLIGIMFMFLISAGYTKTNPNYGLFDSYVRGGVSEEVKCEPGDDFIVQIAPFGCEPAVVRSDLLEEQNVPVFCQLAATQINPFIDVDAIESVSFSGDYSKGVSGVGFHPARAALGIRNDINNPVLENIGYVVVVLREQESERDMPDFVEGNLTARLRYDIKNAFGISENVFYLPEMSDINWEDNKNNYVFWDGRGFIRADGITNEGATITIFDEDKKLATVNLEKGKTSRKIYLPGYTCAANFQVKLLDLANSDTRVRLDINGKLIEVGRGDKFLENKCYVKEIKKQGLYQYVKISCKEDNSKGSYDTNTFELKISPKIRLQVDEKTKDFLIGDKIGDINLYDIASNKKGSDKKEDMYVKLSYEGNNYKLNYNENKKIGGIDVKLIGYGEPEDKENLNSVVKEYYDKSNEDFERVDKSYQSLETSSGSEVDYGEEVLFEKIKLNSGVGMEKQVKLLCDEFYDGYADSVKPISDYCSDYGLANADSAVEDVLINGEIKRIWMKKIIEPGFEDYGAVIYVNNERIELEKDKVFELSDNGTLQLLSIEEDSIRIKYRLLDDSDNGAKNFKRGTGKLKIGVEESFGSARKLQLERINLNRVAKVVISPNIENAYSEVEFPFRIGIEKRSIELSPEKAQEKIDSLNDTISNWKDKSEKLGNVIKGMKGACLATGAILTIKNMWQNSGGKSLARQEVMRGDEGWNEKCEKMIGEGKYTDVEECHLDYADEIDNEVEQVYSIMQAQNEEIKTLQSSLGCEEKEFVTTKQIDTDCFLGDDSKGFVKEVKEDINSVVSDIGKIEVGKGQTKSVDDIVNMITKQRVGVEELRDMQRNAMILKKYPDNVMAKAQLKSSLKNVYVNWNDLQEVDDLSDKFGGLKVNVIKNKDTQTIPYEVQRYGDIKDKFSINADIINDSYLIKDETPVTALVDSKGNKYLVTLEKAGDKYVIRQLYTLDGNRVVDNERLIKELNVNFKEFDAGTYKNPITGSRGHSSVVARYYETEPYAGLGAVIPFDLDNGWYVSVKQATGAFGSFSGNLRSYDDSGAVRNYYICNVMENGIEENRGGDDECRMINIGTGQPINQFYGLDNSEAIKLVQCAEEALTQANRQHGSKVINIKTKCDEIKNLKVGNPAADIPDIQCSDVMSPKDCKILFNLCDPVICPSSRCDFGGKYPVKDVIQSGIIGSVVLCLPNYKEGIYMPVCLTGIKAGIDGYLSVLTAYRDCLQESVNSGKMVGICDEIYSIHLCEFFWRQGLPLAKIAVPKVLEVMFGQNVRGGGEYLGVQSAWENAEKSVDYFTNYYAANSFQAFKMRSVDDVGGEICKNYASGVYPDDGSVLDALTEPDSPPQFHGRFDSIPFTSATVPPVSQYKVYYHIYAGEDSRAYYQVYLKGSSDSSYYLDSNIRYVASGYITTGDYASETLDFTAPTGFTELCIRVNSQEECGFKEVSTSFAVDYVTDKYTEEIVNDEDINSEAQCVSGNPSLYSLTNVNLQSAGEEIVNPEIYKRGIIRVCADRNPGYGTGGASTNVNATRWVDVGWCDKTNGIKCWLDKDSVKESIELKGIEEDALNDLNEKTKENLEYLMKQGDYLSDVEYRDLLEKIEENKNNPSEKIKAIDNDIDRAFWDKHKARLYFERGKAYAELALGALPEREVSEEDCDDICGYGKSGYTASDGICFDNHEWKKGCCCFEEDEGEIEKNCEKYCEGKGYEGGREDASGCDSNEEEYDSGEKFCCCYRDSSSSSSSSGDGGYSEDKVLDCKVHVAKKIIEIAKNIKNNENIADSLVKTDTNAGCFEELVLMQAYQESKLSHCQDVFNGTIKNGTYEQCLSCDGDINDVTGGDGGDSHGVMQLNERSFPDKSIRAGFESNAETGIEHLINSHNQENKVYKCYPDNKADFQYSETYSSNDFKSVFYSGWKRALRSYNGWNSQCVNSEGNVIGDPLYVDNVNSKKNDVAELGLEELGIIVCSN